MPVPNPYKKAKPKVQERRTVSDEPVAPLVLVDRSSLSENETFIIVPSSMSSLELKRYRNITGGNDDTIVITRHSSSSFWKHFCPAETIINHHPPTPLPSAYNLTSVINDANCGYHVQNPMDKMKNHKKNEKEWDIQMSINTLHIRICANTTDLF